MIYEDILKIVGSEKADEVRQFMYRNPLKIIKTERTEGIYDDMNDWEYIYTDKEGYHLHLRAVDPPWPVMTRKQAIAAGLRKYWNGTPCERGHVAQRYVKGGACEICRRLYQSGKLDTTHRQLKLNVHEDDVATVEAFVATLAAGRTNNAG